MPRSSHRQQLRQQRQQGQRRALGRARTVSVAAFAVTLLVGPTAPAFAATGHLKAATTETAEHALIHWINVERAAVGLAPMVASPDLTAVAHRHDAAMAKAGRVFHDPRLASEVRGWQSLGEDVGSASRLSDLEHAFLSTAYDRANLRGVGFRQVGVGTAMRDGLLYVTVIVRWPAASGAR